MNVQELLQKLDSTPNSIDFNEVIRTIDEHYSFTPTSFTNGDVKNDAGSNSGSCKILAFGLLNTLSVEKTLACFGNYYREDVLKHPNADDHANIRNFIKYGWSGVTFASPALSSKSN